MLPTEPRSAQRADCRLEDDEVHHLAVDELLRRHRPERARRLAVEPEAVERQQQLEEVEAEPVAEHRQRIAVRLLTREWVEAGAKRHAVLSAGSDVTDADGNPLITASAPRRPDRRLALLLVNKDPAHTDAARLLVWNASWRGMSGHGFEAAEGSQSKLFAGETALLEMRIAPGPCGPAGPVPPAGPVAPGVPAVPAAPRAPWGPGCGWACR